MADLPFFQQGPGFLQFTDVGSRFVFGVLANQQRMGEALGPENGFVFCSLNGMQKITAITWRRWMTILRQVPDSAIWLLGGTPMDGGSSFVTVLPVRN